jgi:hypothetical protein
MGRRLWVLAAVALMFSISMVNSVLAENDEVFEAGFVEWTINNHERLYLEGSNPDEAVLQRGQTDSLSEDSPQESPPIQFQYFLSKAPPWLNP